MNCLLKVNRPLLSSLIQANKFSVSACIKSNIFNVQDEQDFTNRVINSKKPVIVDFHAV